VEYLVASSHLWLQLGMVKPEIILCEMVLNLSTLKTLTYLLTNSLTSHGSARYWCSNQTVAHTSSCVALKPKADTTHIESVMYFGECNSID